MTREEAKQALKEGHKITHTYFNPDEWVKQPKDHIIEDEQGFSISPTVFWYIRRGEHFADGWEIYQEDL